MITAAEVRTRAWVEHIMGMPVSVHIRAADTGRSDIAGAVACAFDVVRQADSVFSTWNSNSELMRMRRGELDIADANSWVTEVAELADAAASATGGLFTTDLTAPDGTRGWDPTGLVKGWAVDKAAEVLRAVDEMTFSVNAGGDILCGLGRQSVDIVRPWRIGIENPADRSLVAHVLPIVDGAIATSGNAARGAHIIDPRTGRAVTGAGSTSVVGPRLVWADVWATALFIDPTATAGQHDYRALVIG